MAGQTTVSRGMSGRHDFGNPSWRSAPSRKSRGFSIICMNWREHPPAHFRTVHGAHEAPIAFDGALDAGDLPHRALSMVREWLAVHRAEIPTDWRGPGRSNPSIQSLHWGDDRESAHDP